MTWRWWCRVGINEQQRHRMRPVNFDDVREAMIRVGLALKEAAERLGFPR